MKEKQTKTLYLFISNIYTTNANFWIDDDYIKNIYVYANNNDEAINKYLEIVKEEYDIDISKNAIKNKYPIYRDIDEITIQTGYIIKAKTEIESTQVYCDLWAEIFKAADFEC